ncbi:hypothetical protein OAL32_03345 [Synechococcus sp. AH-551-G15]|nr:hypothetical protein [Synechococcus sp. AH-551-G15]
MADFVENRAKCVMIGIPHHPPRLAELCGAFCCQQQRQRSEFDSTNALMRLLGVANGFIG